MAAARRRQLCCPVSDNGMGDKFRLSGSDRLSFVKNGSYYDVDRGVDPDHIIDTYEHFYDREALTEYIHTLY